MATYKRKKTPDSLGLETVTAATLDADTSYVGLIEVTDDGDVVFTCQKLGALYLWADGSDVQLATTAPVLRASGGTITVT